MRSLALVGLALVACPRGDAKQTTANRPAAATTEPSEVDAAPETAPTPSTTSSDAACGSIEACTKILATQTDRDALLAAGVWLASQGEPAAVAALGRVLGEAEFLARLDNVGEPSEKTWHLARIFGALEQHPIPEVAELCVALERDAEFVADPDRVLFLLQAAAAVKPMSEATVALFERTNAQDYAPANALLLAHNASPKAVALLETMLLDSSVEVVDRVDAVRRGLLPVRTERTVLELVDRMLDAKLPAALRVALVETTFDYRPAQWFGKVGSPPAPPPWDDATQSALELALDLANEARADKRLPAPLRNRVTATREQIEAALRSR